MSKITAEERTRQLKRRESLIDQVRRANEHGRTPVGVFDVRGAAAFAGCSETNLNRAMAAGDLDSFVVGGRRKLFVVDVVSWLEFLKRRSDEGKCVAYAPRDTPEPRMPEERKAKRGRPQKTDADDAK